MRGIKMDPEGVELATLDRLLPLSGKRLLEVGCGDGRLTWALAERAADVVAMDPDRRAIAAARRALPRRLRKRVRFDVGQAESLPYPDGAFDAVVFSWSL
jgi:ubiquinone/menaquinone biosynthesis C-methylase UbiE